ncbi:hypothetical protein BN1723_004021 [Verticillium longisporum]|uniref:Plasma membrane proteolipid 3 n=1 Tax=Verticillium longisporum TaxID=100787 RepID=A0A0G4MJ73_VERLO|nr:hypothetical protein BN1723_004021 [Verticillium longisporum]
MPLVDPVTMASTPTKPTTATAAAAAAALQPVPIQQTPAGQAGRYVHPVVLLALFGSQFNALVTDPVRVLVTTLPIVAAVQILLAIILPPVGVFLERGCGADLLINILLTILGYIPGIIHALYIILKY